MYLLLLALLLTALKYFELGPVAALSWGWILLPYALTVVWWSFADNSGYSKRKAAEKIEQRKRDRVEKQRKGLGLPPKKNP